MDDEKDRFGDRLRELEKAREDQWAHEQDRKLIEKQRQKMEQQKKAGAALLCPQCANPLVAKAYRQVAMMGCPQEHGAWLDPTALSAMLTLAK